jgi:hypothetical protein
MEWSRVEGGREWRDRRGRDWRGETGREGRNLAGVEGKRREQWGEGKSLEG